MYGENVKELNVYVRVDLNGEKTQSFSRQGDQGQFWDRAIVSAGVVNSPFQFAIEGLVSDADYSDIAIDDLSFTNSCIMSNETLPGGNTPTPPLYPCPAGYFYCDSDDVCIEGNKVCNWIPECFNAADEENCGACTFEPGLCNWTDISEGTFQWGRIRGEDISMFYHPVYDHTEGEQTSGHYIYVDGGGGTAGKTAVLKGPPILHRPSTYCELHLWIYARHPGNITFSISYAIDSGEKFSIYNLTSGVPQEGSWFETVSSASSLKVGSYFLLEATPVIDGPSNYATSKTSLAIDDISFFDCSATGISLDCNFDDDSRPICSWRQDEKDQQEWISSHDLTPSLPDHTTGHGYFIYIDFQNAKASERDAARLVSTEMTKPVGFNDVFSLWYYFYGENVGTFNILLQTAQNDNSEELFSIREPQGDRWLYFEKMLDVDDDFSIILEGVWAEPGPGMLAVDDVKMGSELHESKCDFENGFCQWQQSLTDDINWKIGHGDGIEADCPPVDHTTNTQSGHYAYINAEMGKQKHGILVSPEYKFVGYQCFKFWYYMVEDNGIVSLSVEINDLTTQNTLTLWGTNTSSDGMWIVAKVTVPNYQHYTLQFHAETGSGKHSAAAIDDVEFMPDVCPPEYECTFEYDFCEWYNVFGVVHTFNWERSSGVEGNGPAVDHTIEMNIGHYLQVDLKGKKEGDMALLGNSGIPVERKCISMWYSMQHITNATLSINLMGDEFVPLVYIHNSTLEYLWENIQVIPDALTGERYDVGISIEVDRDITATKYTIVAVDDVSFSVDCQKPTIPPPSTAPPPTHRPTIYDCNFDDNDFSICSWMQDKNDDLDWIRLKGPTPSTETGPDSDHTTQSDEGYYLYVSTTTVANQTARLISPSVETDHVGVCLSFWYHMHGFQIGALEVQLLKPNDQSETLWHRSHDQGRDWLFAEIHITDPDINKMVVRAIPDDHGKGDIAIDDIIVDYRSCFSSNQLCDFENGLCNYEESLDVDARWELVSAAASPPQDHKPEGDHSLQAHGGHYLQHDSPGTALIFTAPIDPYYTCVEFWLHLDGNITAHSPQLNVYVRQYGIVDPPSKLNFTSGLGVRWNRYLLPIGGVESYYSLGFESTLSGDSYMVALDDIKSLMECEDFSECDFESDFCMWQNSLDDDFDWSLTRASDVNNEYSPDVDVTLGLGEGSFAYTNLYTEQYDGGKFAHSQVECVGTCRKVL